MKEISIIKQLPVITINFEEVKASLKETMSQYEGVVVTEEGLQDCKKTQKELAKLKNNIDGYRKAVKKELEEPIKIFELKCKELFKLVEETEKPIKEGISVFDTKRRLEKVKQGEEYLLAKMDKEGLSDQYKAKISISDITINLSNTMKAIKEEIDQKIKQLAEQQEEEKRRKTELKETIEVTLENVNKTIKSPLQYSDFERYLEMEWTATEVIREINARAEMIKRAEQPKEEMKEEVKEEVKEVKASIKEDLYFVNMEVIGTLEEINKLSQFLKVNNYKYKANAKGRLK